MLILVMSSSSKASLRPLLSPRQSLPFLPGRLQGCDASHRAALVSSRRASWLSRLLSSSHCAALLSSCRASWLSHHLSPSSHCAAISLSYRASWLSHCLCWLSHCLSPSSRSANLSSTRRALLLSLCLSFSSCCAPRHPLVAPAGCCVAARCAALSLSRCLVAPPLVIASCQLVVAPSSLVVLSLHHPLVLSSCWLVVALPLLAPPSRGSPPPTPSNAVERCCHHRTAVAAT